MTQDAAAAAPKQRRTLDEIFKDARKLEAAHLEVVKARTLSERVHFIAKDRADSYRTGAQSGKMGYVIYTLRAAFAGAAIGAVAAPALYATGVAAGIGLAFAGAAAGFAAVVAVPLTLDIIAGSKTIQYLKPSTYKQAKREHERFNP